MDSDHPIGFVKIRTVRRMPSYGLFVVDSAPTGQVEMFDSLDEAVRCLEEIALGCAT